MVLILMLKKLEKVSGKGLNDEVINSRSVSQTLGDEDMDSTSSNWKPQVAKEVVLDRQKPLQASRVNLF